MYKIRIAELNILIKNKYNYVYNMCKDYIINDEKYNFCVEATDKEISDEQTENFPFYYLESLAIYRKIAEKLPLYNGFLMHGALIDVLGEGSIFLAKSGVGKTTHIKLWKELLKDKVKIINGDKPIIRQIGSDFYGYGTPWSGKENYNLNAKTLIKNICFIERNKENSCYEISKDSILEQLLGQVYLSKNKINFLKNAEFLNTFIKNTSAFKIECNKDIDAAKIAYRGMQSAVHLHQVITNSEE